MGMRGARCYYKTRVVTFYFFLLTWIALFVWQCIKSVKGEAGSGYVFLLGILGSIVLLLDYYANKVLRRFIVRQARRE